MATVATPNMSSVGECPILPSAAIAITPADGNTFACPISVYVGGAGIVTCSPASGGADVAITMPAGSVVPFRVLAVKATGTTATLMVAVY
ncbi:hypothetical protein ACFQZQ_02895 [Lysobacter koreensis]|uniref:Uncharacterized protein n=1 Tax=Lysobacter koreensis TaxID=266122 RepID=A0ABW2YIJ2_9GAMM